MLYAVISCNILIWKLLQVDTTYLEVKDKIWVPIWKKNNIWLQNIVYRYNYNGILHIRFKF